MPMVKGVACAFVRLVVADIKRQAAHLELVLQLGQVRLILNEVDVKTDFNLIAPEVEYSCVCPSDVAGTSTRNALFRPRSSIKSMRL